MTIHNHLGMFDKDVSEHVTSQIIRLLKMYKCPKSKAAEITGYDRSSFSRAMKDGRISLPALIALTRHFQVPITFWFPPELNVTGKPVPLPMPKNCVCSDCNAFERKLIEHGKALSSSKQRILKELMSDPHSLEVVELVLSLDTKQRTSAFNAMKQAFKK